jgi:hypothetical protein
MILYHLNLLELKTEARATPVLEKTPFLLSEGLSLPLVFHTLQTILQSVESSSCQDSHLLHYFNDAVL